MSQDTLISQDDLAEYEKYYQLAGGYEEKILNRITVVLRRIFKEFGIELKNWYFDGAEEGEVGNLRRNLDEEVRSYYTETLAGIIAGTYVEMCCRLEDGSLFDLSSSFPSRWLYQDFEAELVAGKAAWDKEREDKKKKATAKRAANKAIKEKAKASAKAKLTPAERKDLGI